MLSAAVLFLKAQTPPIVHTKVDEVENRIMVTNSKGVSPSVALAANGLVFKDAAAAEDRQRTYRRSRSGGATVSALSSTSTRHYRQIDDQKATEIATRASSRRRTSPDRYMAVVTIWKLGRESFQNFTTAPGALSKAIASVGLAHTSLRIGPTAYELSRFHCQRYVAQ